MTRICEERSLKKYHHNRSEKAWGLGVSPPFNRTLAIRTVAEPFETEIHDATARRVVSVLWGHNGRIDTPAPKIKVRQWTNDSARFIFRWDVLFCVQFRVSLTAIASASNCRFGGWVPHPPTLILISLCKPWQEEHDGVGRSCLRSFRDLL